MITEEEINKIMDLAKLDLNKSPPNNLNFKAKLIENLNDILNFIQKLQREDTSNVIPMVHIDEQTKQRLRLDLVTESNVREYVQNIAPKDSVEAGLYLVPKVIDLE